MALSFSFPTFLSPFLADSYVNSHASPSFPEVAHEMCKHTNTVFYPVPETASLQK